jgi:hypothetical protein
MYIKVQSVIYVARLCESVMEREIDSGCLTQVDQTRGQHMCMQVKRKEMAVSDHE